MRERCALAVDTGHARAAASDQQEVLPEGFAVVKETARRLKDNGQLEVTATIDRRGPGGEQPADAGRVDAFTLTD